VALTLFTLAVSNLIDICHAPRFASAGLFFAQFISINTVFMFFLHCRVFFPLKSQLESPKKAANRANQPVMGAIISDFSMERGRRLTAKVVKTKMMQCRLAGICEPSLIHLATWPPTAAMA
jgi:hypothetical protein